MSEKHNTLATEEEVKSAPLKKLPNLKALREARGVTIEEIFLSTRINVAILNAIENGNFHLLPATVYAEKFIKLYAEAIGIDAEIILVHYRRYVAEVQAVPEEARPAKAQITFERKPSKRYLWYGIPALALIAAVLFMYTFIYEQQTGFVQHKVTVDEQQEVVPQPAPAVKEMPVETANDAPQTQQSTLIQKDMAQPPSSAQLNLLIEATENTWLNITEDHKSPYQTTLKKGEKLSRTAQEFFIVDVGNAAGVNITFQGRLLGSLGSKGQVVHLRLPQQ